MPRLLWCIAGGACGIAATLALVAASAPLVFLASLGGSTVFLFGLTRAPAAQPRALVGGHLGGAFIGILCYQVLGDGLWVYAAAQAITLGYMLLTRTVHPPAGANPLIMVHSHATFAALWQPVLVGVCTLAVVAFVWSRVFRGQVRYPQSWLAESPPTPLWGAWNE